MNLTHDSSICQEKSAFFLPAGTDYQTRYDADVERLNFEKQNCGSCKSRGTFTFHSTYMRTVIGSKEEQNSPSRIKVKVLQCTYSACKQRFHALLPEWICPFLPYTYPYILEVLHYYFNEADQKILRTAHAFDMSPKTIRRFLVLLEEGQIPMRQTKSFQESEFDIKNLLARLHVKKQLFWSFLSEFLQAAGHTFFAVKLQYTHNGSTFPYIFCSMEQNQIICLFLQPSPFS